METISLLPQECTNRLHELWGDQYDSLTANEQIVLSAACLEHEISNAWLQPLLELHPTDISKLLGALQTKGISFVTLKDVGQLIL